MVVGKRFCFELIRLNIFYILPLPSCKTAHPAITQFFYVRDKIVERVGGICCINRNISRPQKAAVNFQGDVKPVDMLKMFRKRRGNVFRKSMVLPDPADVYAQHPVITHPGFQLPGAAFGYNAPAQ